jgi:hypothetical protein
VPRISFIYREWFNRYHNKKLICRNPNCNNLLKDRRRTCCSDECSKIFYEFELTHYPRKPIDWNKEYNCPLCNTPKFHRYSGSDFELDHIEPFAIVYAKYMVNYQKRKHKNKKTGPYRQLLMKICREANRPENLQWICKQCHRDKTRDDNGKIKRFKDEIGFDDNPYEGKKIITTWRHLQDYLSNKYSYYYYSTNGSEFYDDRDADTYIRNSTESLFYLNSEYLVFCLLFDPDEDSDADLKIRDAEFMNELEEWIKTDTYKQDLDYLNNKVKEENYVLDIFLTGG